MELVVVSEAQSIIDDTVVSALREKYILKKQQYEFEEERLDRFERKLKESVPNLISRVEDLKDRLQQIILDHEDDFDADDYVEEVKEALDIEDDEKTHTSELIEDAADMLASRDIKQECTTLYRAIAKIAHPDKCKNDPVLTQLFLEAKEARKRNDKASLVLIYDEITNEATSNIVSAYEQKIEDIEWRLQELKETEIHFYYRLNVEFDFGTSVNEYRNDLLEKIRALETMINRETEFL